MILLDIVGSSRKKLGPFFYAQITALPYWKTIETVKPVQMFRALEKRSYEIP